MNRLGVLGLLGLGSWIVVACSAGADPVSTGVGSGSSGASSGSSGGTDGEGGGGAGATTSSGAGGEGGGTCVDTACPPNQVCGTDGQCTDGCTIEKPCTLGLSCCSGACIDTAADVDHCGACDDACDDPGTIEVSCSGSCVYGSCLTGYDCDGIGANGCESQAPCECVPGDTLPCYFGPAGTLGVGICTAGLQTCLPSGQGYTACVGQVLPAAGEICGNNLDDDCDGLTDSADKDGDGFDLCAGDCCDDPSMGCANPELVNPGAFEVGGNMVDDDCDGIVDNPVPNCDGALASNSSNALDYARAIDLCKTTTEAGSGWGVISGSFSRANGTLTPSTNARSIRTGFGSGVSPFGGSQLAVLSTGHAAAQAAPNHTSPAYAAFQGGVLLNQTSSPPADWLSANNDVVPNAPGCPAPAGGNTVHDSIALRLRVRVPTNASSFSVKSFFYSSEYPEWVCSPYNDFFLTLLDSTYAGSPANPVDKNLAFYTSPQNVRYPIGVNLAFGTALFTQCLNGPTGCAQGSVPGNNSSCSDTSQLIGTGFHLLNPSPAFSGDPGWCGASNMLGGGTGWLTTSGNVVPGETIDLRFVLWDTGDGYYDSVVLLDDFKWSVTASQPGTTLPPEPMD